jgi:membrane protein implicated in regulation of membrane protease activity
MCAKNKERMNQCENIFVFLNSKASYMTKKIFGYIAIVIAALLILALLSQLGSFFIALSGLLNSRPDSVALGSLTGILFAWAVQVLLVIVLLRYGIKWVRRVKDDEE